KRFSQEEKDLSQKVGGLGLGLSIAKENVELLGGKITLESEKGKGSTFFVTIPYNPVISISENDQNSDMMTSSHRITKTATFLIVEDEEVNHLYLEALIEDINPGIRTLHAKNGIEAVDMCKNNKEIDFVLMDLKMPVMNGFEAATLIKGFRPNLPIIAQTAYSTKADREKALQAGCDDFISKPISEEAFNRLIDTYLTNNKT
ncbi:MAG: histidine kinase, partial [Bacteroidetes bacterium]